MNQPPTTDAPAAKTVEFLPPPGQVYSLWEFARLTPGQFDVIHHDHGNPWAPGDRPPPYGHTETNHAIPARKLIQFIAASVDEAQRRWAEFVCENYLPVPRGYQGKESEPVVRRPGALCPKAPTVILSRQEVIGDDDGLTTTGWGKKIQFSAGHKKKVVTIVAKRYGGQRPEFPEKDYFFGKPKIDADGELIPLNAQIMVILDPEGDNPEEEGLPKIVEQASFTFAIKPTSAR